jgi:hypothetical protein
MDIETAKFMFQILQFLLTGGIGIYVYLTAKNRVTNERISTLQEDIDTKLDGHAERIASLETAVDGVPTHRDLGTMHEKINAVSTDLSRLGGRLEGIDTNVRMILSRITERGMS